MNKVNFMFGVGDATWMVTITSEQDKIELVIVDAILSADQFLSRVANVQGWICFEDNLFNP